MNHANESKRSIVLNMVVALVFCCCFYFFFDHINNVGNEKSIEKLSVNVNEFEIVSGSECANIEKNAIYTKEGDGEKVFSTEVSVGGLDVLFVDFIVNCPDDDAGTVLSIGLCGEKIDNLESYSDVVLAGGKNEVRVELNVSKDAMDNNTLCLFTFDDASICISDLSVWGIINNGERTLQNLVISVVVALISFAILMSLMNRKKKCFWLLYLVIVTVSLGIFLKMMNIEAREICGDEAVYIAQAYSLAYDKDNVFEEIDLIRFYTSINKNGPSGIFLNYSDGIYFYSKPYLYGLCGAPFVWLFGHNGLNVFNLLCWFGLVLVGFLYLRRYNKEIVAFFVSWLFCSISIIWAYIFESYLDIFNAFTLGVALLLFFDGLKTAKDNSKYLILSGIVFGSIAYQRTPFLVFVFFCFLKLLLDKKINNKNAILFGTVAFSAFACFTAVHIVQIGTFSPYGGYRYYFDGIYPGDKLFSQAIKENALANTGASSIVNDILFSISDFKAFVFNLLYFFVGRQTGILIYFPCILIIFLNLKWQSVKEHWFVLMGICAHILFFMLQGYDNYYGGAQAVGNRYFLQIMSACLFLITTIDIKKTVLSSLGSVAIYCTFCGVSMKDAIVQTVMFRSRDIMTILPLEYTQFNNMISLEGNAKVILEDDDGKDDYVWLGRTQEYYSIENQETNQYWTRGDGVENLIIVADNPIKKIKFDIMSGSIDNQVTFSDGKILDLKNGIKEIGVEVEPKLSQKFYGYYYYSFSIDPKYSFVPAELGVYNDSRNVGVCISNYQLVEE